VHLQLREWQLHVAEVGQGELTALTPAEPSWGGGWCMVSPHGDRSLFGEWYLSSRNFGGHQV